MTNNKTKLIDLNPWELITSKGILKTYSRDTFANNYEQTPFEKWEELENYFKNTFSKINRSWHCSSYKNDSAPSFRNEEFKFQIFICDYDQFTIHIDDSMEDTDLMGFDFINEYELEKFLILINSISRSLARGKTKCN